MSKGKREVSIGLVATLLVLQVALGLVLSQIYLSSHNTLFNNGNWKVTKTELWNGLIGSYGFLFDLQPLARGHMNVAAWHGCQEVVLKREVDPVTVEFDFYLHTPASYLTFFFDRTSKRYTGLRFSRHKEFSGAILTVTDEGRFVRKKRSRPLRNLKVRTWHQARVEFADGEVSAFVNGVAIKKFKSRGVAPQHIGFRGGLRPVFVDNLRIVNRDGSEFRDNFNRPRNWPLVCLLTVGSVLFLMWGCFFVVRRFASTDDKRLLFFVLMFTGVLVAASVAALVLVSQRTGFYPNADEKLKLQEAYWKDATAEALYDRVGRDFPQQPAPNVHRVFFMGSSQTAGAGARTEKESFVWRTEKMLNDRSESVQYELINVAVRGYHFREMARDFDKRWVKWNPHTVIVNASHNDRSFSERFREDLDQFVGRLRRRGIEVILIKEPNTGERPNPRDLTKMHDILAEIGARHSVPVIDMHNHLAPQKDDGFLWWDWVHMTSLGQRLFAEFLVDELERLGAVRLEAPES